MHNYGNNNYNIDEEDDDEDYGDYDDKFTKRPP